MIDSRLLRTTKGEYVPNPRVLTTCILAVRKSDEKPRDFGASSNIHIANVLLCTRCWGTWCSSNFAYKLPHLLYTNKIIFEGVGGILHS